jgi:leucyl aminopeptidase
MKIKIDSSAKRKTELLCGFVLENSNKVLGLPKVDSKTTSSINQSLKDMNGKLGKLTIIPIPGKKTGSKNPSCRSWKKRKHYKRYNKICFR